jgi:ribokinase
MGAEVVMVGCVGSDADGDGFLRALHEEGIDVGFMRRDAELPTGHAQITVDAQGRNSIVVATGANDGASFPSAALEGADVLLAQLECPLDVVSAAIAAARGAGVTTILNSAPARPLTDEFLALVDYLIARVIDAYRRFPYPWSTQPARATRSAVASRRRSLTAAPSGTWCSAPAQRGPTRSRLSARSPHCRGRRTWTGC